MQRLRVTSSKANYQVVVGRGAWRALRRFPQNDYTSTFVLTERALWMRWGKAFCRESRLRNAPTLFLPAGETSKSLKMVERVAGQMLERRADRGSLLIAFGGGVVGDLGGFVASTFMRGIDYIQVPTTVVAQVDSAIGGKTAVNVGQMKNLVGTFCPPRLVLAEPLVLSSLSDRAFRSGLYEAVKHAILAGPALFDRIEAGLPWLRSGNTAELDAILAGAAKVKVEVVSRDEREAGLRRVLNLGHTFGHALEEATRYRRFMHGEAVGWGMLAATNMAVRLGILDPAVAHRIVQLVRLVGPLPNIRDLEPADLLRLLPRDKKAVGGRIHWVLPERIGKVRITAEVPTRVAAAAFRDTQRAEWHE
ncbi:MAG TPA: 3-dehydroquinate synthase [Terriglobia bacterium]|nr:3-dehydroquinate synthase [Terriglobia bacterium]